jgi:membrane-associated protease RseP (regulator of RpoE activity)
VFALKARMRFALTAASVLFAGFVSTAAFADEAAPPPPAAAPAPAPAAKKLPLRVVRVLTETHQALLFDKTKGTHVLVEIGKEIDGFKVDDIDEDTVTLTPIEGGAQIVLAGPDPSWRRHAGATKPAAAAPEDPYASAAPMDPYGADDVPSVEAPGSVASGPVAAPIAAGDGGVRTAAAPSSTPVAPRTVSATGAPTDPGFATTPVSTTAPATAPIVDTSSSSNWSTLPVSNAAPAITSPAIAAPAASATATSGGNAPTLLPLPTMLSKSDVAAALSNFGALAGSMRGSFTPAGAKIDAVGPDSLLAKAGLRAGDVITSINNQPLRSLDDAANLYARAGSMKVATIVFQRAGKPMMLRLTIQ